MTNPIGCFVLPTLGVKTDNTTLLSETKPLSIDRLWPGGEEEVWD